MNAPRMRRRYRTSSPRRGLLYLLLFLALAAFYVGQQVYAQRLGVALSDMENKVRTMESTLGSLRAERDRLTSPAVLGPRAGALGLRAAAITQLARVPLTLPPPVPGKDDPDRDLSGVFALVWQWLDGPTVQKQEVLASP